VWVKPPAGQPWSVTDDDDRRQRPLLLRSPVHTVAVVFCSDYMAAYESLSDGGGDIDEDDDATNHVKSSVQKR